LWTMRQFSGFATPEETNRRYHYLLQQGQTGLSVAFDLPTLMGYDAGHPMSEFPAWAAPEETSRRYAAVLQQGQTGLSVAFDLPTLMGYDAGHPMSAGEVGKCGVNISSLEDMEVLFRGIP